MLWLPTMGLPIHEQFPFQEFPSGFLQEEFWAVNKPLWDSCRKFTGKKAKSPGGNLKGAALKIKD